MSRVMESKQQQGFTKAEVGPLKWMVREGAHAYLLSYAHAQAPESLKQRTYSVKSDAWSFGALYAVSLL